MIDNKDKEEMGVQWASPVPYITPFVGPSSQMWYLRMNQWSYLVYKYYPAYCVSQGHDDACEMMRSRARGSWCKYSHFAAAIKAPVEPYAGVVSEMIDAWFNRIYHSLVASHGEG